MFRPPKGRCQYRIRATQKLKRLVIARFIARWNTGRVFYPLREKLNTARHVITVAEVRYINQRILFCGFKYALVTKKPFHPNFKTAVILMNRMLVRFHMPRIMS